VPRIGTFALELVRGCHPNDVLIYDEHADAAAHLGVAHLGAAPGPRWACAGHHLAGVTEQEGGHRLEGNGKMTE
jgi:hypothetical protein